MQLPDCETSALVCNERKASLAMIASGQAFLEKLHESLVARRCHQMEMMAHEQGSLNRTASRHDQLSFGKPLFCGS